MLMFTIKIKCHMCVAEGIKYQSLIKSRQNHNKKSQAACRK